MDRSKKYWKVKIMQQNSFQKNGLLNVNNSQNSTYSTGNFGRRSVQEIRDDMYKAKTKDSSNSNTKNDDKQTTNLNNIGQNDYRQRVENLQNFNRWK